MSQMIPVLSMIRYYQAGAACAGLMQVINTQVIPSFAAHVIEDPYRQVKIPGKTQIPAGSYTVKRRKHGRIFERYNELYGHEFVWEVMNVPNFTDVLIHIGNTHKDTAGCLCLNSGMMIQSSSGEPVGQSSSVKYREFYHWSRPYKELNLSIVNVQAFGFPITSMNR